MLFSVPCSFNLQLEEQICARVALGGNIAFHFPALLAECSAMDQVDSDFIFYDKGFYDLKPWHILQL